MLKIDKNAWHFKAYKHWVDSFCEEVEVYHFDGRSRNTSLCTYVRRVVYGVLYFTARSLSSLISNALWLCAWPIFASCALLCGFIPNTWDTDGWKPYRPFILFNGRQYHLSIFMIPILFLICVISGMSIMPDSMKFSQLILFWSCGLIIPIIITSLFYLVSEISMSYFGIDNSFYEKDNEVVSKEKPNLVFEYFKAKKEKVCPLISFDD